MKKNNLSRKEFLIKSSKCIGGIACTSITASFIQSCSKPEPFNNITSETEFISECPCHLAQFDQEGNVIQHPNTGEKIEPLIKYNTQIIDNEIIINNNNNELILNLTTHSSLQEIGGTASIDSNVIDPQGLLLYRKNQTEIIALSKHCTHEGCTIGNFEKI